MRVRSPPGRRSRLARMARQTCASTPLATAAWLTSITKKNAGGIGGRTCVPRGVPMLGLGLAGGINPPLVARPSQLKQHAFWRRQSHVAATLHRSLCKARLCAACHPGYDTRPPLQASPRA